MRKDFRDRQAAALGRRLYPATGLTAKMLARGIGVHAATIANWARGESVMDAAAVEAVDAFFAALGDWAFIAEVYGDWRARALKQADDLERRAAEIRRAAHLLGEAAA